MNSEGDYLWDKTSEPDAEIQELEKILGTLRYQPRPLEIPTDLHTDSRPGFFAGSTPRTLAGLAIAATLAAILVGVGLWFGLQRSQQRPAPEVVKTQNPPVPNSGPKSVQTPDDSPKSTLAGTTSPPAQKQTDEPRRARHETRGWFVKNPELAAKQRREAEAAKDQLMLALRLASAKLNFAQRKTQNTNPRDPVHNQHKIG